MVKGIPFWSDKLDFGALFTSLYVHGLSVVMDFRL